MKFEVEMRRELIEMAVVEIEAEDEADAARKVQTMRESLDWSTTDSNYDVVYVHDLPF